MPTNRPPSLSLSYSPTLAHPLIPLFYSLLFFSPFHALLFPSFLLPSLSLLFYSATTRLLLLSLLSSLILAYPPFLYSTLPILFTFFLSSSLSPSPSPCFFLPLSTAFFPSLLSRSSRLVSSHLCRQPLKRNEEVSPLSSTSPCLLFSLTLSQQKRLSPCAGDTASTLPCPHLSVLLQSYHVRYLVFT